MSIVRTFFKIDFLLGQIEDINYKKIIFASINFDVLAKHIPAYGLLYRKI